MMMMMITGRMPVLNLLTGQKSAFVAPIQVKCGTTKGHVGPLGHTKSHANRFTGVGTRLTKYQNFHILVNSRLAGGEPLDRF